MTALTNMLQGYFASLAAAKVMNAPPVPTIADVLATAVISSADEIVPVALTNVEASWNVFLPERGSVATDLKHYVREFFSIYVDQGIISSDDADALTEKALDRFALELSGFVRHYTPGEAAILELIRSMATSADEVAPNASLSGEASAPAVPLLTIAVDASAREVVSVGDDLEWYRRGTRSVGLHDGFPPTAVDLVVADQRALQFENAIQHAYGRPLEWAVVEICRLGMWHFADSFPSPQLILQLVEDVLHQSWMRKDAPDDVPFDAVLGDCHFVIQVGEDQVARWEEIDRVPRQYMQVGMGFHWLCDVAEARFLRKGIPGMIDTFLSKPALDESEHLNMWAWKLGIH